MMRVLRWAGYSVLFVWAARLLYLAWLSGALSTWSFWILAATAAFEVGGLLYLLHETGEWKEAHLRGETFEARRAENRLPRKRFGNTPRVL